MEKSEQNQTNSGCDSNAQIRSGICKKKYRNFIGSHPGQTAAR